MDSDYEAAPEGNVRRASRLRLLSRIVGALILGLLAGLFVSAGLGVGLRYHFSEEQKASPWGGFIWAEHWVLRVIASFVATFSAGIVTGLAARRQGRVFGAISSLPIALSWTYLAISAWQERLLFVSDSSRLDISIGNKVAATFIAATMLPISAWAGHVGEEQGVLTSAHFDARRFSLLGIKWYHYLWLPFAAYVLLIQLAWAIYDWLEWMLKTWDLGLGLASIIGTVVSTFLFGTIYLMCAGASRAYKVLSGFEYIATAKQRALAVLKYGFGWPVLAVVIQATMVLVEYGLEKVSKH